MDIFKMYLFLYQEHCGEFTWVCVAAAEHCVNLHF